MGKQVTKEKALPTGGAAEIVEVGMLDALQDEMASVRDACKDILSALESGLLPNRDAQNSLANAIKNACELRSNLTTSLFPDATPEQEQTLQSLSEAVEKENSAAKKRRSLENALQTLQEFTRLYSISERHETALNDLRQRIAAYTEDEIAALVESDKLPCYECFLKAVADGIIDDATEDRLADVFGDMLVTALVRKTILIKPPDGVVPPDNRAVTMSSDEDITDESALDEYCDIEDAYEGEGYDEIILDLNKYGIVLPLDSDYGTLDTQVAKKTPKGVKAFLNELGKKPADVAIAMRFVAQILLSQRAASLDEFITHKLFDEDFASAIIAALTFLEKEGFVAKYTISTDSGSKLFCLTLSGEKVLLSQSARKLLGTTQKENPSIRKIYSAADYLRMRSIVGMHLDYLRTYADASPAEKDLSHFDVAQVGELSFCRIVSHESPDVISVPCFFSADEEDELGSLLDAIMDDYRPDAQIRIVSGNPELENAWQRLFRDELAGTVEPECIMASSQIETQIVMEMSEECGPEPEPEPKPSTKRKRKSEPISEPEPEMKLENEPSAAQAGDPRLAADLLLKKTRGSVPALTDSVELMMSLTERGMWVDLLTLAKAFSFTDATECKAINRRFEYALDITHDPRLYGGEELRFLDTDTEVLIDIMPGSFLQYSSWAILARACFAPAVKYDRELESKVKQAVSEMEGNPQVGELKNLLVCLLNLLKDHPSGFSRRVLQTLLNSESRKKRIADIRQRAGDMLTPPNLIVKMDGAGRLREELFGKHGELCKALSLICRADSPDTKDILSFFSRFSGTGTELSAYDRDKVEEYINEKWKNVRSSRSIQNLAHDLFDKARNNLERRLDVISEWLDLTSQGVDDPVNLVRHSGFVSAAITKAIEELDAKDQADSSMRASHAILRYALCSMQKTLSGNEDEGKYPFISLLEAPYIGLNDKGYPDFNEELNELPGFEPWRLALKSVAYMRVDPLTALKCIDDPDNAEWFSNYGTAEYLQDQFIKDASKRVDYSKDVEYAESDAVKASDETLAYINLRFMNGCIEEQTREAAESIINGFKDRLMQSRDFARFNLFLHAIKAWVDKDEDGISQHLRYRLEELGSFDNPDAVEFIRGIIDKGLLSAAEEYIIRLESNDMSFIDGTRLPTEPIEILEKFLSNYDQLYNDCWRRRENNFLDWTYNYISLNRAKLFPNQDDWISKHGRSAEEFIKSWLTPGSSRHAQDGRVDKLMKAIFGSLILKVAPADAKSAKLPEMYEMSTVRAPKNRVDYEHPISLFGTDIPAKMKVVPIYGTTSPTQIYTRVISDLRVDSDAIIVVDGVLSINERMELARKFKPRMSGTVLVIDRVLMLYLAMREETERMRALLVCTLPYSFYNPYSNDGSPVNDEMFMGRKSELSDIRSMAGACLVYGGRQLGKTALLTRACSIEHNPAQNEYALLINIENTSVKDFARKLAEELASIGIQIDPGESQDIAGICSALNRGFKNGKIKKLLLAMDEADSFLEEDRQGKNAVLQQFVNLRQQTTNRFKCVFAGLHNVMRSKSAISDSNSPLAKLGKPLCIRPLSLSDAQQLVRYPLAYLGYRISDDQLSMILPDTNFYPGVLHLFCYEIIKDVAGKHDAYYAGNSPPFEVDSNVLGGVRSSASPGGRVREKIHVTLHLDERYWKIANAIAHLCYEKSGINDAFSVDKIMSEMAIFSSLKDCGVDIVTSLLDEMCEMGILYARRLGEEALYCFRRNLFLSMIGSADDVTNVLLEG